jgi:hypothetical protein
VVYDLALTRKQADAAAAAAEAAEAEAADLAPSITIDTLGNN